jgi:signal transduction histidine kinase/ligand-binding sensor domain-containing protein/DNA-binding response OmpR family regulator
MWFATDDGLNKFDGTQFTIYRHRAGDSTSLPANEIVTVHEDRSGNLWLGTSGGALSLYDRKKDAFINFPAGNADNVINSNVVLSLCSDSDKLWIGSFAGINLLDLKTYKISKFSASGNEPFIKTTVCLFQDSKHVMWIGTTVGLCSYDPATKKARWFVHDEANKASLTGNVVKTIMEDNKGRLWVGTTNGISMKTRSSDGFINYRHVDNAPNTISKGEVNSIALDDIGRLWIGTTNGLDIFDTETGNISNIGYDKRNVQGLADRSILTVYNDHQGIFWLGTLTGGVSKYDKNLNLFNLAQSMPFDTEGLPSSQVSCFEVSRDDRIFVGTEHGGVSLFDPKKKTFKRFNIRSAANPGDGLVVLALKYTKKQELLIGTFGDGLIRLHPETGNYEQLTVSNGLASNDVFAIVEDRNQNIWLGSNGSGLVVLNADFKVTARYNPNPVRTDDMKLPINGYIRDLLEDRNGNMWIATHGGGIAMLKTSSNQFSVYNSRNSFLASDKVQSLYEDSHGNIWAGTFGGGLARFNYENKIFSSFSEQDGLANNNVYKILEDKDGKLWMSTNQGISSFDVAAKKFWNYNLHNGLQPGNFSCGSGLRAKDGQFYFGGQQGFNYFYPSGLIKNNNIPQVLFTNLKISNESVTPSEDGAITENISVSKEINLDYKQNFALSFVGLNYTAPGQNQYAYKLEGFDKDWVYTGNTNTAVYTNLDPGEYVFRVRASNNDGLWNNQGSFINITVHPPFWRTTYAYIFYALAVFGILLFSRYKGIQKVKLQFQREQEKMQIEQERKDAERIRELDSQKIKFLTNLSHEFRTPLSLIMSPIDSLIRSEHSEQSFSQLHIIKRNARRLLNLVNQLLDFRKMEENELKLHPTVGEFIAFARETTDSFRDLAERKKINLVFDNHLNRLDIKFDHDKNERILFNLLSNAFKFTLEGGSITLQIKRCENNPAEEGRTWLCIKVCDTGVGIPADKTEKIFENFFQVTTEASILNQGTGIGLSITKEFVRMQGGTIRAESEAGKGSAFIMELPFENAELPLKELMPFGGETKLEGDSTASQAASVGTNKQHEVLSTQPSVLLVEDNDDFRIYLKDTLRTHYKIYEASNGKEGWQKALAEHPQLIVSDVSMPYMDGIELCKKIKSDKRTNHIPVILLTALADDGHQLKGLEYGANDYITKPFNCEMLNAKVQNLLTLNDSLKNTYLKQIKVLSPETVIESEDEKLLSDIIVYLEEHLTDTQLSVEGLSRHIGKSRSSLYTKILELTGETPVEFIRSVKLDKAAVLLEKSDMNIAQIAYSAGFATPNYFAKSFKAKFNMLPSEYVSKMRNK